MAAILLMPWCVKSTVCELLVSVFQGEADDSLTRLAKADSIIAKWVIYMKEETNLRFNGGFRKLC